MKTHIENIRVSHYAKKEGDLWIELKFDYRIPDDLPPLPPAIISSLGGIRVAKDIRAHALKTVDGRVWDVFNGFREKDETAKKEEIDHE